MILVDASEKDKISPLCIVLFFYYICLCSMGIKVTKNFKNLNANVYSSQLILLHVRSRATFSHMLVWNDESGLD